MMVDLDDILLLSEAAEAFGRQPDALRKAAEKGRLTARRIGPRCWITTRSAVAEYVSDPAVLRRRARIAR